MTALAKALLTPGLQHLIAGLGVIGAVSGLAAVGTVPGGEALGVIVGVGSLMLGGTIATTAIAANNTGTTP